jgi:ABC-type uncharacterized transport system substrate-binding protein
MRLALLVKMNLDRVPELVAELVRLNPDVIVAASRGARVAHQLTKTIPIVALGTSDVVTTGLVAGLAHPGGNRHWAFVRFATANRQS